MPFRNIQWLLAAIQGIFESFWQVIVVSNALEKKSHTKFTTRKTLMQNNNYING